MTAFDQLVQRKAEAHLNACLAALDAQDAGQPTESPASAPFCGCNTCVVREILIVTYDLMLTEARREILQEIANTGPHDYDHGFRDGYQAGRREGPDALLQAARWVVENWDREATQHASMAALRQAVQRSVGDYQAAAFEHRYQHCAECEAPPTVECRCTPEIEDLCDADD